MKHCCRCKTEKAKTEFHKNKSSKDGLHCYCKECLREYKRPFKTSLPSLSKRISPDLYKSRLRRMFEEERECLRMQQNLKTDC